MLVIAGLKDGGEPAECARVGAKRDGAAYRVAPEESVQLSFAQTKGREMIEVFQRLAPLFVGEAQSR
jgi:hypothetical protein